MSKLQKERLNQMIENALSYKQEVRPLKSNFFYKRFKELILKPKVYGLTFSSLVISCVFIPTIMSTRNIVEVIEINDYVTFRIIDDIIDNNGLNNVVDAIFVDFHAEATSEKLAMGYYLDGRVSMIAGTHTHIPTSDARILSKGTGYISDVGMSGDYDSILGFDKQNPLEKFISGIPSGRFIPAKGEGTFSGILFETNSDGLISNISPIKFGGIFDDELPDFWTLN